MAYVSDNTTKKKKELETLEASKPAEYKSQHQSTIDEVMDQIVNRKQFSYDFNADPLYQHYKDNYIQQGNQAMMNTMANVATLTGGYGNSYATSAGAQANQQYLGQLNNVIPELYAAAMDKYNMDTDALMNSYSVATDAEGRDYSRYADALANYNANREYLYGQYLDSVGQDQYKEQFDYQKNQDALAYQQWLDQFNYQKVQDEKSYQQWLEEFNYQKAQDEKSYQQWLEEFNYQKAQDEAKAAQAKAAEEKEKVSESDLAGLAAYVASKSSAPTPNYSMNNLDAYMNVSNVASKKAQNSKESAASYLASMVNNGTISQFDADKIYASIIEK